MFQGKAGSPEKLIAGLPPDRAAAISRVREVILANLPPGYVESMQYGMIGYGIPLERYPDTYNGQPLDLIGETIARTPVERYIAGYERARQATAARRRS